MLSRCYPSVVPVLSCCLCRSSQLSVRLLSWCYPGVVPVSMQEWPGQCLVVIPVLSRSPQEQLARSSPEQVPAALLNAEGPPPSPVNPLKERIIQSAPKPHLTPAAQTVSHGRAWMNPGLISRALLFLGLGDTPVAALCVPKGACGDYFDVTLQGQELSSIWCCKQMTPWKRAGVNPGISSPILPRARNSPICGGATSSFSWI